MTPVDELAGPITPERFAADIVPAYRPVVLRGLVADWPAVAAARGGVRATVDYLLSHERGGIVEAMAAPAEARGRFFYRDDMAGFNFERHRVPLRGLVEELARIADARVVPALYAGASAAPDILPGWTDANPLPLPTPGATPRLWIGNASHVSTHYDTSSNIACVVAGARRFTLFPPDQIANLYVGPLDRTIAGQPTSMVDVTAPDLQRYPRFAAALDRALVAELAPGDAIYLPPLWWHDVQATGALNVLVNYWWGTPETPSVLALAHAMMSLRDLPEGPRAAWAGWFDHYVFGEGAGGAGDHLPPGARGALGPFTPELARTTREYIAWSLSRR